MKYFLTTNMKNIFQFLKTNKIHIFVAILLFVAFITLTPKIKLTSLKGMVTDTTSVMPTRESCAAKGQVLGSNFVSNDTGGTWEMPACVSCPEGTFFSEYAYSNAYYGELCVPNVKCENELAAAQDDYAHRFKAVDWERDHLKRMLEETPITNEIQYNSIVEQGRAEIMAAENALKESEKVVKIMQELCGKNE